MSSDATLPVLSAADFASDQDVRWCPGCGDYSILAQMKKVLPAIGVPREKIVFVSGIGCSSNRPGFIQTYGRHSLHGRAVAIASGVHFGNHDLKVIVTGGDGDGYGIGLGHFIHAMRRNLDRLKGLVFSQRVLLALAEAGMSREAAYEVVQSNAAKVWAGKGDFLALLAADPRVGGRLGRRKLEGLFDVGYYTRRVDAIFRRVFGPGKARRRRRRAER
jgi:hypothetical protein